MPNKLPLEDESLFQKWYAEWAKKLNLHPNPDHPAHFYDYRAAYKAGATPSKEGHWPSKFKLEGHPRTIVNGWNTKTGKPAKDTVFPSRRYKQ